MRTTQRLTHSSFQKKASIHACWVDACYGEALRARSCLTESFPSQAPLSAALSAEPEDPVTFPLNPESVLKKGVPTHFDSSATVISVILDRKGIITCDDVYHYVFDSAHSRSEHPEL